MYLREAHSLRPYHCFEKASLLLMTFPSQSSSLIGKKKIDELGSTSTVSKIPSNVIVRVLQQTEGAARWLSPLTAALPLPTVMTSPQSQERR